MQFIVNHNDECVSKCYISWCEILDVFLDVGNLSVKTNMIIIRQIVALN